MGSSTTVTLPEVCNTLRAFAIEKKMTLDEFLEYLTRFPKLGESILVTNTEELLKARRAVYGDIRDNANCQYELKEVLYKYRQKFKSPLSVYDTRAHTECLEYVLEKLARIITAPTVHEDSYEDIKGYIELARKIAMGESTAP